MPRPANETGAVIAVDQEIFVSEDVAVLLRYAIAYSVGLEIRIDAIRGPVTDKETWLSSPKDPDLEAEAGLHDDGHFVRVDVRDERGVLSVEPDSSRSDENIFVTELWCDRAPVGEVTVSCEWRPFDVHSDVKLDREYVEAARLRTHSLW